jgi:hypothetical protein
MTMVAKLRCKFVDHKTLNLIDVTFRRILMSRTMDPKQLGCHRPLLIFSRCPWPLWFPNATMIQHSHPCETRTPHRCRAPLHKGCPKHQGHKGDPGVTPGTCGAGGEKAQVILVWVRAPGVGNASHPRRLGVTRVRP